MTATHIGSTRRSMVKYGFRGAWAGMFAGAIGGVAAIVVIFFGAMLTDRSTSVFGATVQQDPGGGFSLLVDVRPLLTLVVVAIVVGGLAGIAYARRASGPINRSWRA